ncbi:hypothetical protein GCM10020000_10550 [Streptomyces olivoverticillatus]
MKVASSTGEAVLFAKVYDVGPNGQQQLPGQLVVPVRVGDAKDGRAVELRLPAVDHTFESGHRMRLVLAATDLGYASPAPPGHVHRLPGGRAERAHRTGGAHRLGGAALVDVGGLPVGGVLVAAAVLLTGRRRTAVPAPDPALADVPLQITGLSKRYAKSADRYAVQDLGFRVERGQVLGLLGPNGAGKTTTLRMLMGLIRPDAGEIRVFGHAIRPGAPVLSRVGAFVEGAGFLPHLSGRANLDLYWRATGRLAGDAHVEEALEIAGLGPALERAVRTYSQGMRQRLAIAQAMLGLPDLLILDEPTNGLDPPQIREMREVMIRYAAAEPHGDRLQSSPGRGGAVVHPSGRDGPRAAGQRRPGGRDHRLGRHAARGRGRLSCRTWRWRRWPPCRGWPRPCGRTRGCWCGSTARVRGSCWWSWSGWRSRWRAWARTGGWRTRS